ncbi:serine hydrolase [Aquimarina sp. AU474]|uniref:serine hydrolase domain-containing protein n=1 Tax=Aquimarina sp. AU474 TaxID=2108529 RepID=UPI00135B3854|nr:serine hydrolase domain-containing protein [Aquimarina sp. AU474]
MKSLYVFGAVLLLISSCAQKEEIIPTSSEKFATEVKELKEYFQIPGLAVSVEKNNEIVYQDYLGYANLKSQIKLDSTALFPIASLTKVFSGVLMMKLVEQGRLSLDDSLKKYLPEVGVSDSILVKHILSHTSQGEIGKKFYYSSRFGALTTVIEKATGKSFETLMTEEIFEPLGLKNTYLLKDSLQIVQNKLKIAEPYRLENGIENGFIDYGFSTSAGIVSNLGDLRIFNQAFDDNRLISESSRNQMFTGVDEKLPYGYGIFSQQFEGLKLIWAYGQYDCYSSLLLKIPSKKITLTLLANNNLMSDPARLIYGDVTASLFALSFLKNYVLSLEDMALLEIKKTEAKRYVDQNFYRKKLLSEALAASFMARFDQNKMKTSTALLHRVFLEYPNYLEYADINLLHNLTFLKDIAFYKELGEFNEFDKNIEAIGVKLLKEDSNDPYLHMYMGTYYDRKGDNDQARYHFEHIVNADNFSKNWYTSEASNWIKEHKE